jgi:hypothetical protein
MSTEIFELLHNGVSIFQGTEKEVKWKLLRSQEMSIQWATTHDGWEIKKVENGELLIQKTIKKNSTPKNG